MSGKHLGSPENGGAALIDGADPRAEHMHRVLTFHEQELKEAPHRGDKIEGTEEREGMPPVMIEMHRQASRVAQIGLAELGVASLITDRPETAATPAERRTAVPAPAMPEVIPAIA